MQRLKQLLDRFYRDYDFRGRTGKDPISFPGRYKNVRDIEAAGFIAASLAYGRADLFMKVVDRILSGMGQSPHAFLHDFDVKKHLRLLSGISYRFNTEADIAALLYSMGRIIREFGSLEAAFMSRSGQDDPDIRPALSGLMHLFLAVDTTRIYGTGPKPPGLLQFFPLPERGSACKRANLYLRWMVRDKDIDFGIWKGVPKDRLIIPLDTHIARISRCLGLTQRTSQDWKTAEEITAALRKLDPEDPLKYDFALCHHGISGACRGTKDRGMCSGCVLK